MLLKNKEKRDFQLQNELFPKLFIINEGKKGLTAIKASFKLLNSYHLK